MIEIKKTGICDGCTKSDLFLQDYRNSVFDDHIWRLECNHREACERLAELLAKDEES